MGKGALVEVVSYSIEQLKQLLAEKSGAKPHIVAQKNHVVYFESYFAELKAATIVVENDYVDRDFLEDFAAYYVRCFNAYRRRCSRLHFFSSAFDQSSLLNLLEGKGNLTPELLQDSYLGFIVIKPLPETIVGRTCLKCYDAKGGMRCYPVRHRYEANLFGLPLHVETLPFQEQDTVAAACATSALWSAFHGTGRLFQHSIPSPIEITHAASKDFPLETRSVPNRGLTVAQMAHAVRSVGLEPSTENATDEFILKSTLYAYLNGGLPVLLGIALFDVSKSPSRFMGKHAVAVTGFGLSKKPPVSLPRAGFLSRSNRIDRLYTHDDQVGPFARMIFDDKTITIGTTKGEPKTSKSLSTSWLTPNRMRDKVRAIPEILLLPLYHKIRIPFGLVQNALVRFDTVIEDIRAKNFLPLGRRLEWDFRLSTINRFKQDAQLITAKSPALRREILLTSLPRFIWRATGLEDDKPAIDLIFDATDIEQGAYFVQAVGYNEGLFTTLKHIAHAPTMAAVFPAMADSQIVDWFRSQPLT